MRTTYTSANQVVARRKNAKYISGLPRFYHRLVGSDLGLVLKYYRGDGRDCAAHCMKFLLIDDHALIREALQNVLKELALASYRDEEEVD